MIENRPFFQLSIVHCLLRCILVCSIVCGPIGGQIGGFSTNFSIYQLLNLLMDALLFNNIIIVALK